MLPALYEQELSRHGLVKLRDIYISKKIKEIYLTPLTIKKKDINFFKNQNN